MADKLSWGIISTGRIAGVFAKNVVRSKTGQLLAVGSRSQESANRFGDEFGIPRRYASYEALLADPDIQAVYIATPHPLHTEWAIKAAEAGKHILCEKPIGINYAQAMAAVDAARRNDVFLMEAFMYRGHPQIAKLGELIREGAIGEVRMIQAHFGFQAGFNPEGRLFSNELGGGGILDVGCYPVSIARFIAGAAQGKPFAEPIEVRAMGHLGQTGIDEYSGALMRFAGDLIAYVTTSVTLTQENVVRIFGSGGSIFIPNPWNGHFEGTRQLIVNRNGQEPEVIEFECPGNLYSIEADTLAASIEARQAPSPAMSWDDTLGNMKTLDQWRAALGFAYNVEKLGGNYPTVDGRPLRVHARNTMKYGEISGVGKPVSRLVIGHMGMHGIPIANTMLDEFFRCGGNCFDTAYIYGQNDAILGQWIKSRGIREQAVLLVKGAHTPMCYPEALTNQLNESLERLQTDYADIYMMHRDNLEIPVGEFIDVLNEHIRAGRIRAIGASNWTLERIRAANDYAQSKGLRGFSAISNNFSLAQMVEAPWAGCIAASDPESRGWFEKTQTAMMPWSSTGRGFFMRGNPEDRSNADLVRCWYREDNFRRLERAKELAERKGVTPTAIAMAYVLNQPFPTFPLFGPANLDELHVSLEALKIGLTPEEIGWLNLED